MVGKILSNLIAGGEYIIGSSYIEDEKEGTMKVVVETTDGKKVFDESGQMLEQTDRQGNKTFFKDGIPVKTVSPSGTVISKTQVQRTGQGDKWIESRDYMGNLEKRRVNAKGEMVERIDQSGRRFRVKAQKDSQGQTVAMTEINQASGTRTTRFMNPKTGEVEKLIDEKGDIIVIQYQKDDKGRKLASLEKNTNTGLLTEKQYDSMGRETMIVDSSGMTREIAYEVNGANQVSASVETIQEPNGETHKLTKTFDGASRVTSEVDSRGKEIEYSYTVEEDGHVSKVEENETVVNDRGEKVTTERVKIMNADDRIETVFENGFRIDYTYEEDENGRVEKTHETKYIADTMEKLYTQTTEMDANNLPSKSEKWEESGPIGKRHSITYYSMDPLTGKTKKTSTINDLGDLTETLMDENGQVKSSETWQQYGAKLKRHSITTITTDSMTGLPLESRSVDDMGNITLTTMDEKGLAERSESWSARGALLKRHSVTQIETNPLTGKPEKTTTVNDRGDVTVTYMNGQGMAVLSQIRENSGPKLGRDKVSTTENDPYTGMASSVRTQSALGTSLTMMDSNGLPVSTESDDVYGASLKRHKTTELEVDINTGLTQKTTTINDRDDKVVTTMDDEGMPVISESWNSLGAELKKYSLTQMSVDPATEMTRKTSTVNDLGDISVTNMDENGFATDSLSIKALGAILKQTSLTMITTDENTGQSAMTDTVNLRNDRTQTWMDENGLAVKSEGWLALGPELKKHSLNEITSDQETGETSSTLSRNDRGDVNQTWMDEDGLAFKSEGNSALGAELKKHSFVSIATSDQTGETTATVSRNERSDETVTTMDENGLAVKSVGSMALGAILKRTNETAIETDINTGETAATYSLNNRNDRTWTRMNDNGMAVKSRSINSLGATLKRTSMTAIETDINTGETAMTSSINNRNDHTVTKMNENGLAIQSQSSLALGATLKRDSETQITTDGKTGETAQTLSINNRGDHTWTGMNADGLATVSESWSAYGANLKRHSLSVIQTDSRTGETAQTTTMNDRGDQTWTGMNEHGLAVKSESWLALGAAGKAHSVSVIEADVDTGETISSTSINDLGDKTKSWMDDNGLALKSEGWMSYGAILKRHNLTMINTDSATGETRSTQSKNDRGDRTDTTMDSNGLAVRSVGVMALGANLKRRNTTQIITDQDTGESSESISINDRGDKTHTWMNEHGLAILSDSISALGATLKRHSATNITTNAYTGETTHTVSINDRGDVSQTWMDKNGLAVKSDSQSALGANLKKHSVTDIITNQQTGEMDESLSKNDRGDLTHTYMDENGLAIRSEAQVALGAVLKCTSETAIQTDVDTGETAATYSLNQRGDRTWSKMDGNGLAESSHGVSALGATLKRTSTTAISTNKATGETDMTYTINDRSDKTATEMNENGLAVQSHSQLALGASLKRTSTTQITTNADTGETDETLSVNNRGDRTWTGMNRNGLARISEGWSAYGALLKRHNRTMIVVDEYTGETSETMSSNDRGDITWTGMNEHGLAVQSEGWLALGAIAKRHNTIKITADPATGETQETLSLNDRGDETQTWMDENGLAEKSEGQQALGAIQKRHNITLIDVDTGTGETRSTRSKNDRGDITYTKMNKDGLAVSSESVLVLGAILKRTSRSVIKTRMDTGETEETHNVNNRGDETHSWMDADGLATRSESWLALGAELKKHSMTAVETDCITGETRATTNNNDRGDTTSTLMDVNGLAYRSDATLALGAALKKHSVTEILTNRYTGETSSTFNQNDRNDRNLTTMDENGLAVRSESQLALGAILKRTSETTLQVNAYTGETEATYSLNLRGDVAVTEMDGDGLPVQSYNNSALGANLKKQSFTTMTVNKQTGETAASYSVNELGDRVLTLMDDEGLPVASESWQVLSPVWKAHTVSEITVDKQTGETKMNESVNGMGDRTITHMDENGLVNASESWQVLGAKKKQHSVSDVTVNQKTGETLSSFSTNDLNETALTLMDEDGLAYASHSEDKLGPLDGRTRDSRIDTNPDTGVTQRTSTTDKLHSGPVITQMDIWGMAIESQGTDRYGAIAGRSKRTTLTPNPYTGLTMESFTYDALHTGAVHTTMDENGFAVESTSVNKYGPSHGRHQVTQMTPDKDTGMTAMSESKTLSGEKGTIIKINETTTYNDPVFGAPEYAESTATFGAFKNKVTEFTDVNENTGLVRYSNVVDGGGTTENEHNEFGVAKSTRYNILGAIKKTDTINTMNTQTGMIQASNSSDRKGRTNTTFNQNGLVNQSVRTNFNAHYVVAETTTTQSWNAYTGSPLVSVSLDGHGTTTKYFDLDSMMEKTIRVDQWGDKTTTSFVNNRLTGMPITSKTTSETGTTETLFEDNGLAMQSTFTAKIGLHNTTTNYYAANLDMKSTKSVDERGNISVSVMNSAGEVTHSYSKSGTTTMDLKNNRAATSSGPGGSSTYYYSGKWLDKTVSVDDGETTTSWMEHRNNGATRKVKTKDGTTSYNNSYNSRGFVSYRTESNGKGDTGFSNFNSYGDQIYSEWTGKMKKEPADRYGNQFLGGTWVSKTTYKVNSRGDTQSWTTKSSWSGTQHYAEIGHYEPTCLEWDEAGTACVKLGDEKYVVDQAAHNKKVGGSKTKSDTPDHSPKSDVWVVAHLSGSQLKQGTVLGSSNSAQNKFGVGAAAVGGSQDATKPGYHSVYQKKMIASLATVEMERTLKENFRPTVKRMQAQLEKFKENPNLLSLRQLASYTYSEKGSFEKAFAAAGDKVAFLRQAADDAYYYYSGNHLSAVDLSHGEIEQALFLVERQPSTASLQDWLGFFATDEQKEKIGKDMLETSEKLAATEDAATQAYLLEEFWAQLASLIGDIAAQKMGNGISETILVQWLSQAVQEEDDLQLLASRMLNDPQLAPKSTSAGSGVALSGGGAAVKAKKLEDDYSDFEDMTRIGIEAQVAAATVAKDQVESVPQKVDLKLDESDDLMEMKEMDTVLKKLSLKKNQVRKIAGLHHVRLKQELEQGVVIKKDKKGRVKKLKTKYGNTLVIEYKKDGKVSVKIVMPKKQLKSLAEYRKGWLKKIILKGGSVLTLAYPKGDDGEGGMIAKLAKGMFKNIYKYGKNGKLKQVVKQEGDRSRVEEFKQEEELDAIVAEEDKLKDDRIDSKKLGVQKPGQMH
ncbi:hypothetical protein K8S19_11130 [bacterium]|nr:hypothetical protein [bacterium]